MNAPPYAAVVVTFNHVDTLPATLQAIAALDPGPAETVLIDNASLDGSADAAARWRHGHLVRMSRNVGFAAAVNHGLRMTTSPWILLLNPDCAPRRDYVARLFAAATDRPETEKVGSITGRLLRTGDEPGAQPVLDAAGMVVTPSGRHHDRGAGTPDDGRFRRPAWVFGGTGAATLYRRIALDDVAYADGQVLAESFFAYREDAELAWRLQWRGWRCLYAPAAVALHRRGLRPEAGRRRNAMINAHSVRNRFLLRAHCADWAWHLRCFPWWLGRDLLVLAACLTVERRSLSAFHDLWRLRADALRRRRWILSRRSVPSRQVQRWFRIRGEVEEL